jgi:hypothetical protein
VTFKHKHRKRVLVRADGAGATHQLLDWLAALGQVRGRQVEHSVGFPTKNNAVISAITKLRAVPGRPLSPLPVKSVRTLRLPRAPACWTCPARRHAGHHSPRTPTPTESTKLVSSSTTAIGIRPSPRTPASGQLAF